MNNIDRVALNERLSFAGLHLIYALTFALLYEQMYSWFASYCMEFMIDSDHQTQRLLLGVGEVMIKEE